MPHPSVIVERGLGSPLSVYKDRVAHVYDARVCKGGTRSFPWTFRVNALYTYMYVCRVDPAIAAMAKMHAIIEVRVINGVIKPMIGLYIYLSIRFGIVLLKKSVDRPMHLFNIHLQ